MSALTPQQAFEKAQTFIQEWQRTGGNLPFSKIEYVALHRLEVGSEHLVATVQVLCDDGVARVLKFSEADGEAGMEYQTLAEFEKRFKADCFEVNCFGVPFNICENAPGIWEVDAFIRLESDRLLSLHRVWSEGCWIASTYQIAGGDYEWGCDGLLAERANQLSEYALSVVQGGDLW